MMMSRQSPRRNLQRSKGMKVKHVLQASLLLGVCIWLLFYQMPRLNNDDSSSQLGIKSIQKVSNANDIKLGRKDLKPKKAEIEDEKNKLQPQEHGETTTSVDGKTNKAKHIHSENQDEEENRGDKEKHDGKRGGAEKDETKIKKRRDHESSHVEEDGKHHKLQSAGNNAKNDTEESKSKIKDHKLKSAENNAKNDTEETKSKSKIKENATKDHKLKSGENNAKNDTEESKSKIKENATKGEEEKKHLKRPTEDEENHGKETVSGESEKHNEFDENSKSNDTDSASSPRSAPKHDMELSPSSTTQINVNSE